MKRLIWIAGATLALAGCDNSGDANEGSGTADSGNPGDGGTSQGEGGPAETGDAMMETGNDTNESSGFIIQDLGNDAIFECLPFLQDCMAGQKCMPWANDGGNSWNATKCVDLDENPVAPGDTCAVEGSGVSGIDNCELASMCWDVDPETNEGTCVAFCQGTEDNPQCDDPDASCVITNGGVLILCLPQCDPLLAGMDCLDGQGCYPVADSFNCAPDASGPDDGVAGDPCEFLNACDPGLICTGAAAVEGCQGSMGCCSPVCDLQGMDACPGANEACEPWFDPMAVPPGFEDVGVCALPG